MTGLIPHLSILTMFIFFLIRHSFGNTEGVIDQVCKNTYDYAFCKDIFLKHVYTPNIDMKGLSQIALTQTLLYVTNTQIFIKKAIAAEKDKNKKNLYKICEVGYGILLDEFNKANLDFAKGDYKSMVFEESKCDRFVTDCESVIGSKVAELSKQNKQNRELVRMAYVAGQLLLK